MKERLVYFDIAKFLGLMMIILGHFGVPDINTFVYTFHVPLFFLISGYFFTPKTDYKTFIKTKFKQLIIPYFLVMFCVIILNALFSLYHHTAFTEIKYKTFDYLIGYLYGSGYINNIKGYQIQTVGPIWFCLALFWDFVLLNYLISKKHLPFILAVLFVIGYYSSQLLWLPFSIQSSMTSVLFVYIGYLAKKYNIMNYPVTIGQILPLLCLWGICIGYGGRFLIVHNYSVFFITDIIAAIAACYLFVLFCRFIEENAKSVAVMAYLGRYTLVMLCFHNIDITIMPWNEYYLTPNTDGSVVLLKLLITIFKFIFPILGALWVSKVNALKKLFSIKS